MSREAIGIAKAWTRVVPALLPFADVATRELPLGRLLRLSLFQVSVGMAAVLLTGTLNRVMIVELGVPGWLVALMVSIPLVFAPLRALIGFRSDTHRSVLGWRRVPYIWFGSMFQFGGLAIMPFALILLSGDSNGPAWIAHAGAGLAFLLVGAGMHTTQTAGLALATDLATEDTRPRVVALLYVMLLLGMMISALVISALLADFGQIRLIQVIQGTAALTMILNTIALWKQEARDPQRNRHFAEPPRFGTAWRQFVAQSDPRRLLVAVGLGAAAFSMQDVLLEPYGGQILKLSVGATTMLTALWALGTLIGFTIARQALDRDADAHRLAGYGGVVGIAAFSLVILAAPLDSAALFRIGVLLIGLGGGLFAVGTLVAAMALTPDGQSGLALGAWGAVQATAAGLGILVAGTLRDVVSHWAAAGVLGPGLASPAVGYLLVYALEIALLFAMLIAIGPLARWTNDGSLKSTKFGLAEFPT